LLIVIVVVGILAVIIFVVFSGVQKQAQVASLASDLNSASKQLSLHLVEFGVYPDTISCPATTTATTRCINPSPGDLFTYSPNNSTSPPSYWLTAAASGSSYHITNKITAPVADITCPTGFVIVPGSVTFGTNDFCVMKYEAKNVGGVATSQAAGLLWIYVSQDAAKVAANAACSGCHLLTEAEWLTIAQNVTQVGNNWETGVAGSPHRFGTGFMFNGNTGGGSLLAPGADDNNSYVGTSGSLYPMNRRTLDLSNGSTVWDFAGNAAEWTQGQTSGGQPVFGGPPFYISLTWFTTAVCPILPNPNPAFAVPGITDLMMSNSNIGGLYAYSADASLRGFVRGGSYNLSTFLVGPFMLDFRNTPTSTNAEVGFRVAK